MSEDVLHRFCCCACKKSILAFETPLVPCVCGQSVWRKANSASYVSMTNGLFGAQYDSIDTLDIDVDEHRVRDQEERSWKEIEESRRQ